MNDFRDDCTNNADIKYYCSAPKAATLRHGGLSLVMRERTGTAQAWRSANTLLITSCGSSPLEDWPSMKSRRRSLSVASTASSLAIAFARDRSWRIPSMLVPATVALASVSSSVALPTAHAFKSVAAFLF